MNPGFQEFSHHFWYCSYCMYTNMLSNRLHLPDLKPIRNLVIFWFGGRKAIYFLIMVQGSKGQSSLVVVKALLVWVFPSLRKTVMNSPLSFTSSLFKRTMSSRLQAPYMPKVKITLESSHWLSGAVTINLEISSPVNTLAFLGL